MTEVNWAGTHAYRAERIHRPATTEQLQEIVAAAPLGGPLALCGPPSIAGGAPSPEPRGPQAAR